MLQTDPELRPEMEEVWQVTRSVFDHQHQASRSTHLTCEMAMDKVTLLATEVQRQRNAREVGLNSGFNPGLRHTPTRAVSLSVTRLARPVMSYC
jgi:hypothetical protein